MRVKFRKKDLRGEKLFLTEKYVSNGHWLLKREVVADAMILTLDLNALSEVLRSVYDAEKVWIRKDSLLEKAVPEEVSTKFLATPWIWDPSAILNSATRSVTSRVFESESGDRKRAFFQERYFDWFGFQALWGSDPMKGMQNTPDENWDLVIMPVNPKVEEALERPLILEGE